MNRFGMSGYLTDLCASLEIFVNVKYPNFIGFFMFGFPCSVL